VICCKLCQRSFSNKSLASPLASSASRAKEASSAWYETVKQKSCLLLCKILQMLHHSISCFGYNPVAGLNSMLCITVCGPRLSLKFELVKSCDKISGASNSHNWHFDLSILVIKPRFIHSRVPSQEGLIIVKSGLHCIGLAK
jgi:hypothetical protein